MQSRECVDVVVARYPHRRQRVSSLYEHSSTFREVCADYHTASSTLDEVRRRPTSTTGDEDALLALLADLEGEIEQYLDPHAAPPPPSEPRGRPTEIRDGFV